MLVRKVFILSCVFLILTLPLSPARTESTDPQKDTEGKSAVPRENLGGLIYPAGIQVLPASTSGLVIRLGGNVFTFSNKQLMRDPYLRDGKQREKYADFLNSLVTEKTGDILYESADGGYFVVPSGKISDLGEHYLYDFDAKDWPNAGDCEGVNDKGFGGKGLLPKPQLGHCYALWTVNNNPILFRIIALNEQGLTIQWILDNHGGGKAIIPRREPIVRQNEPVPFVPEDLLLDVTVAKNSESHLQYRRLLIARLISVAKNDKLASSSRADAIRLLGELRATEAVNDLMDLITFVNSERPTPAFTEDMFVSLVALQKIGKPASLAAVQAITSLGPYTPEDGQKWARNWQFTILILRIEGPIAAKIMLEDAMAEELKLAGQNPRADDPHKIAADDLQKAIDMMAQIPAYE
jgi:hypothetical protein